MTTSRSDRHHGNTRDDQRSGHDDEGISANAVPDCVRTVHRLDTFTTPAPAACHERAIVRPRALVCVSAAVATVIPNGVEAARFAAAAGPAGEVGRAAWRDRLSRYVLAVGGIEPRKGTLDLGRALAQGHRWEAAAAAHRGLYEALGAAGAAGSSGAAVRSCARTPRFMTP